MYILHIYIYIHTYVHISVLRRCICGLTTIAGDRVPATRPEREPRERERERKRYRKGERRWREREDRERERDESEEDVATNPETLRRGAERSGAAT